MTSLGCRAVVERSHSAPGPPLLRRDGPRALKQPKSLNAVPTGSAAVRGLQLVADVAERRGQLGSEELQGGDEHDADESRDQAVFNGGGAAFVFDQLDCKATHNVTPGKK